MDKETQEIKAKFFAQYLFQDVFIETVESNFPMTLLGIDSDLGCHVFDNGISLRAYYDTNAGILLLKDLSSISDEDAIALGKIFGYSGSGDSNCIHWAKFWIDDKKSSNGWPYGKAIAAVDYLRSKSYALPFLHLSLPDLIKLGWVKLK